MQDLKHACRMFAKQPGLAILIVVTLALGIGANTAAFSIIEGVLLRPLPYKDPARLIDILDTSRREKELAKIFASYADFEEYSKHARGLEGLGAVTWAGRPNAILTGRGPAKTYLTIPATVDFFKTLGVAAQRGRTFSHEDLRGGCAVVLSDKFWRGPLGGDASVVGQSLSLDDRACTVLGVMPVSFAFYPPETQIWSLVLPDDPRLRTFFGVFMVARLKPTVSLAQVRSELDALHSALHSHDSNGERDFEPLAGDLQDQFTWLAGRNLRTTLGVLSGAVVFVLSIACLNVANLLLGRSFERGREFAIRAALGAGRVRLIRQLTTEAALLSSAGGGLGLLLAFGAVRNFVRLAPIELPVGAAISIDLPALIFTFTLSIVTAMVFGVAPAWRVSRGEVHGGLRATGPGGSPGRQLLSRLLIAAEMALSLALLAGAGLLMRSVVNFGSAPLGFDPNNVIAANGSLPMKRYRDAAIKVAFYDRLDQGLGGIPGVESAAIASTIPPYGLGLSTIEIQGRPIPRDAQLHDVGQAAVGPGYFRVFHIPVRRGRVFNRADRLASSLVAVVNEALAREYFPGLDPIGQQIRIGEEHEWLTIAGVVGNERRPRVLQEMSWDVQPAVYRALAQNSPDSFSIAVRGTGEITGTGRAIERIVASIDSETATGDAEPMRARLDPYLKYPRFRATVLSAFASLAILLAAVGLYGVLAQFVAHRTREIGLRMAIGAARRDILVLIAKQGGIPVVVGLVFGLVLTVALAQYLSGLLYGVTPGDPATFGVVAILMLVAASLAIVLPARRASRVDPMIALRAD